MTDAGAKPGRRRKWVKRLLISALAISLGLGGLAWYVSTDSFQAMVRRRLVAELARVTGGRVELGSIHTIPFRFVIDVRNLTIHGREAPGGNTSTHTLTGWWRSRYPLGIRSRIRIDSPVSDRPIAHVIFYPGRDHQPARAAGDNRPQHLVNPLSLSIGHLEVRHGSVLWNHQDYALDVAADDVSVDLNYSLLHRLTTAAC